MAAKKTSTDKRNIETNKSYIEGSPNLKDGDFVGGDKVTGLQPDEIVRLVETIIKYLALDYRNPEQLASVLQKFQKLHKALYEWKELHNLLDDILNSFNQYYSHVNLLNRSSAKPDLKELRLLWFPVYQQVTELVEFAKNIKLIGVPYVEDQSHLEGERWVLEILSLRNDLDKIFHADEQVSLGFFSSGGFFSFGVKPQWWNTMYELTGSFYHTVLGHLHQADKKLRESAANLYTLSESVFRGNNHE